MTGKLPSLPRLRALRHFDLQFICIDQVTRRDAEPRGGHLLDRTAAPVTIAVFLVALFVFAAFAGVRLASDPVHGDSERLMRLFTD